MRTAVVGHVEWVEFARVPHIPRPGEIVHGDSTWTGPGGGGAGAAVQLVKLSTETLFFTAVGDDSLGRRAADELQRLNVKLHVAWRPGPTRRAFTHIDGTGERTITVLGDRLGPHGADRLPWAELKSTDATYFTAGDEDALRRARDSRVLVATSRALDVVRSSRVKLDALVGSATDPDEAYATASLDPVPKLVVMTSGATGGAYWTESGVDETFIAPELDGPVVSRYGAGDSFAGGLTLALGAGASPSEAVAFAARCGAAVLRGTGPFEGQLTESPFA
ncbi:MAG: PfkB family carbohydrate kinase [Actinomycetota bacterium]|nr:PfkB family carbohydrate kinase [Actinomycetota bacterium]